MAANTRTRRRGQCRPSLDWAIASGAAEALALMNPVHATATPKGVTRYKTEPYVLAGDVYDNPQHRGRGGWSWYTGSAGWYYRVALESVLGLEVRGDRLSVRPCIRPNWPGYSITLRYRTASYEIRVENGGSGKDVRELWLDGARVDGNEVRMTADGRTRSVRVVLA